MITIFRNPNFTQWFNVCLYGKLIDNARTIQKAVEIAEKLRDKEINAGRYAPIIKKP